MGVNGIDHLIRTRVVALRSTLRRHPTAVSLVGGSVVAIALVIGLAGHGHEFVVALGSAPFWVLGVAVALHVLWLVARSEAWGVCIGAAGGSVSRRRLYRASSLGYLCNIFNGQFGLAVRIAALRRTAPSESPRPSILLTAELPIVVVEMALAAIFSFTLVAPLGVPWWVAAGRLRRGGRGASAACSGWRETGGRESGGASPCCARRRGAAGSSLWSASRW